MFWWVLLLCGAFLLAVTNRSFWIDECVSAQFAREPSLAECWSAMRIYPELQLPLYMIYLWTYVHVIGAGEWILRMAGFPWLIAGASLFVYSLGRQTGSRMMVTLLIGLSPFAWYYMNEARVYSLQLGTALALTGSAVAVLASVSSRLSAWWTRLFLLSLWLLCGTSILGALWGCFLTLAFVFAIPAPQRTQLLRLVPGSIAACVFGLAGLAAYYGWTMLTPAKPTPGVTSLKTTIFVGYELLGAAGLGPGRSELRTEGTGTLVPYVAPLSLFGIAAVILIWHGIKELVLRFGWRKCTQFSVFVSLPIIIVCMLGVLTDFRVLGRHATPLLSLLLGLLAFGAVRLAKLGLRGWIWPGLFLTLCVASCLSLRFSPRHEKDDYRSAAALARSALQSGQTLWWTADEFGAKYYGLPLEADPALPGPGRYVRGTSDEALRRLKQPDLVIISKPEIYDYFGAVQRYVQKEGFRRVKELKSFEIWKRDP